MCAEQQESVIYKPNGYVLKSLLFIRASRIRSPSLLLHCPYIAFITPGWSLCFGSNFREVNAFPILGKWHKKPKTIKITQQEKQGHYTCKFPGKRTLVKMQLICSNVRDPGKEQAQWACLKRRVLSISECCPNCFTQGTRFTVQS